MEQTRIMELAQSCAVEAMRQHDEFGRHVGEAVSQALATIPPRKPKLEKKDEDSIRSETWEIVNKIMANRVSKGAPKAKSERSKPLVGIHTRKHGTLVSPTPQKLKRPQMVDFKERQLPRGQLLDDQN